LIYQSPSQRTTKKSGTMLTPKKQFAIALLLVTVSLLSFYPAVSFAKPEQQSGTISIVAPGQDFPLGNQKCNGQGSFANLTLSGNIQSQTGNEFKIEIVKGSLNFTLGKANLTITGGHGELNKKGMVQINARALNGTQSLQLILHGSINNGKAAFACPQSKLAGVFFLSLSGTATVTTTTTTHSKHH